MKIAFHKLNNPVDINIKVENIVFVGELSKKSRFAELKGNLKGELDFICDVCSKESQKHLNEPLELKLTNKPLSLEEENDLDIVECLDIIDIEEIINSELNSHKSDYNKCNKCQINDNDEL